VVHHRGAGIGVMFHEPQPDLYRGLAQVEPMRRPPRCAADHPFAQSSRIGP
jgi:hypothetical protein